MLWASNSGDQLAAALHTANVQSYSDTSANVVLYNANTREGAALSADGTSLPAPKKFTGGDMEQKAPFSFTVDGMTVNVGNETDSKGNRYGLDISGT